MKQKLFMMLAALMVLGTSAMAQSETLKGDVNADGVVDVADIAAVIKIMTDNGDIEKTYYWYVGQENPAEMTSISPIVDDNTSPGWRLIGTEIGSYTIDKPLWEGSMNPIVTGATKQYNYIALPNSTLKLRDGDGNIFDSWTNTGTKEIAGVKYYIYQSPNMSKGFGIDIF